MTSNVPSLPPRNVSIKVDENSDIQPTGFHSPLALLITLETSEKDHKHVFKSFTEETVPTLQPKTEENLIELVDPEEIVDKPTNDKKVSICQTCHVWLHITHTEQKQELNACLANDYICHHYHTQEANQYECCGCQYTLTAEFKNPVLPLSVLTRLEATRPKGRSFADLMQQKEQTPTMVSTLTTVLVYIKDLLNGTKRNINTSNPHFLARIGLNDGSQALLEALGFQLNDENYFIAPDVIGETRLEEDLESIQKEIIVRLDMIRQELGVATVPLTTAEGNFRVISANMQQLLGIDPKLENRYTSKSDYLERAYTFFGLTSGASDKLVSWTYNKLINEPTTDVDPYNALDSLLIIANQTNSDVLQTLIACERSKGRIARTDIGDAYAYFGVDETIDDDALLIGLYQVKLSDEPTSKNLHQEKLKIIAIAKNSTELIQFLKEERGILPNENLQSVEDMMGVPAHMINSAQQTGVPVGLENIGNTCYFNSLLQYYYTFLPFRETIINNGRYVEDENMEPKRIGNIQVNRSEIQRAKKFVNLLGDLFVQLAQSNERSIAPNIELAYMALLNEKEEEDEEQETVERKDEKQETVETKDDVIMQEVDQEEGVINQNNDKEPETDINHQEDNSSIPDSPPPTYNEIASSSSQAPVVADVKTVEPTKPKKKRDINKMMFGGQQDVTECMDNVMYLVEAALKPVAKTDDGEQIDDMIRQVFYGKGRQIISYLDSTTHKVVKKEKNEDFAHVILDGSEGKDLYDGLDQYFFEGSIENFSGGEEVTRQVTVKQFPPVLQVVIQRVQFDRITTKAYKSNAFFQFDKEIYLDRYMEENFENFKDKRTEVAAWRAELDKEKKLVEKYSKSPMLKIPVPDLLNATLTLLEDIKDDSPIPKEEYNQALQLLQLEAQRTRESVKSSMESIAQLREKIINQYKDYSQIKYKLHAVFIHQGQADVGHYWIYILDHEKDQWWKYNDARVTKVNESEILCDTTGSTANPYFVVYVDASRLDEFVTMKSAAT